MDKIQPMEPVLTNNLIEGPQYIHQIKWDGIRIVTYIEQGNMKLLTKRGHIRTTQYVELKQLTEINGLKNAVFDGEVIAVHSGKPSFQKVLIRDRTSNVQKIKNYIKTIPVYYVIFDILYYKDKDLRKEPFNNRFELLNEIVTPSDRVLLAENFNDANDLYTLIKENNYEGIVSKKNDSIYVGGKLHKQWYKYKLSRKMLCIVCGIRLNEDERVKSLHLGINIGKSLSYIGTVSSGLTQNDIKTLGQYKEKLSVEEHPFKGLLKEKNNIWFQPLLTCWISFMEWTDQGVIRHGKILGFSDEKWEDADGTEYIK